MDAKEIMKKLQAPFSPEDIEWRVGATNKEKTKGIALAYVTNRAIMNRLDEVVGPFNWQNKFREWKNNSQICAISIKFGDEWITKEDGADDSNEEAVKGGLSDAMKRAGYQWGIGRYLYNLENQWVPIEPMGKSYRLSREPRLPAWALPEGYSYEKLDAKQTEKPQSITPKVIGDIKSGWMKLGYKQNDLDPTLKRHYGCKLSELPEDKAQAFLQWIQKKIEGGGQTA
ncbi:hypothetical protein PN4B1_16690 [Paenibacillus naphthalenovorans]|uniref:Rad52/Rad22 family DNA repair protein n=1 Tax=Paenibacillus naphthalenovorans TaxID=162209 RepID=UPI0010BB9EEF|nr:Rad52/Rad22 family DNA repair protein [Paenibacillus naphthalenovorans]GCL71764.1 hypothetical protein PN4B1_16690 [Paenibacillus naphthalenovorans]